VGNAIVVWRKCPCNILPQNEQTCPPQSCRTTGQQAAISTGRTPWPHNGLAYPGSSVFGSSLRSGPSSVNQASKSVFSDWELGVIVLLVVQSKQSTPSARFQRKYLTMCHRRTVAQHRVCLLHTHLQTGRAEWSGDDVLASIQVVQVVTCIVVATVVTITTHDDYTVSMSRLGASVTSQPTNNSGHRGSSPVPKRLDLS
jgi:hypothetical protein